jgi:Leucine-rich repeat (LRR) protein
LTAFFSKYSLFSPVPHYVYLTDLAQWQQLDAELKHQTIYLSAAGVPIQQFNWLAEAPNLEALNLSGTAIVDLAPLAALSSLSWLDLSYTRVQDLSPLTGLRNLSLLNLEHTEVTMLEPLFFRKNYIFISVSLEKINRSSVQAFTNQNPKTPLNSFIMPRLYGNS